MNRLLILLLFTTFLSFATALADESDGPKPSNNEDPGKTTVQLFDQFTLTNNSVIILDLSLSMEVEDPNSPMIEEFIETGAAPNSPGTVSDPKHIFKGIKKSWIPTGRSRIARAKYEVCKLIYNLPDGFMFNIILFHEQVGVLQPNKMIKSSKSTRRKAINFTLQNEMALGTRTDLALQEALKLKSVDTIFLITDGAPTPSNRESAILAQVRNLNKDRGVKINSLGFDGKGHWPAGKGKEPKFVAWQNGRIDKMVKFLKDLASQNGGSYRSIK
jgi:hypothetical protein